jgi:transposase InsO family protein
MRCLKRDVAREIYRALTVPWALTTHESVHGCQYTSLAFGRRLTDTGLIASVGSRGDSYDNALARPSSGGTRPS